MQKKISLEMIYQKSHWILGLPVDSSAGMDSITSLT